MRLNLVPASQGVRWVQLGIATFFKKPIALMGLFFIFVTVMSLLSLVPMIGLALALALLPSVTLGFMSATREVAHGNYPMPTILLSAFRAGQQRMQAMLVLGFLYAALFGLIMGITWLLDDGQFVRVYLLGENFTQEQMLDLARTPSFQLSVFTAATLNVLLGMLFWHAPALVHWHDVPAVKSLFFSLVACLRNFKAFFLFGMAWLGLALLTAMFGAVLLIPLAGPSLGVALMQMLLLIFTAMLFASQYFSYRDCFVEAANGAPQSPEPPPATP